MYFLSVLDQARQKLLPQFKELPPNFYLVGGTGLALQLNHRISEDFDFFCENSFDTQDLYASLSYDLFPDSSLKIIQEDKNTLDILTESIETK